MILANPNFYILPERPFFLILYTSKIYPSNTMAEVHSPTRLPTPSHSTGRRPSGPKLRDSCHACATSKVKCHKEKPTCSRCAKRGLTCEYVATKRGGRKHDHRSSMSERRRTPPRTTPTADSLDVNQFIPQLNSWFAPTNLDTIPSPGIIHHQSPKPTISGTSTAFFPGLLSPSNPPMTTLPDLSTELDGLFNSSLSFPVGDMSDSDVMGQANFFSTDMNPHSQNNNHSNITPTLIEPFPLFENAITEISLPSSDSSSPTKDPFSYLILNDTIAAESPACSCLIQALGLMKQIFPNPPMACMRDSLASRGLVSPSTPIAAAQEVVAKNEAIIEAINAMLQCPCSHDGYLLTIMSLIVFKILGWYAAAARKSEPHRSNISTTGSSSSNGANNNDINKDSPTPHPSLKSDHVGNEPPNVTNDYHLDGEDSGRMAAQLVLSELHRVQRLVNQLSQKLKMQATNNSGTPDTPDSSGFNSATMDYETGSPLSPVMLDQLEVDLKKRLKSLSWEIVEGLRRG
ncbi:aflatoxin regulatory protein-domain-containing protein [Camillea tinctor]|nr:aflatoxin regulatory protein-domain-containing protein [Camillea tinctor]